MKFTKLDFSLLLLAAVANANSPVGFAGNTIGGEGGVEYHVNNIKEFIEALNNNGNPTGSKIIYVESQVNGAVDDNGNALTAESLAPGFTFQKYINCFTEDGTEWLNTDECNALDELRLEGAKLQAEKIKIMVTPNTTIIGNGEGSRLEELSLQISGIDNVIIKNISIEAPNDLFPEWDPTDGIHGSWNSEYDAIVITNSSTRVWIDNCYLTDGSKGVNTTPLIFGQHVELHDGLIDVVNGADFVTISNNRFENHKKTMLIGNSDKKTTDRDHLKVSIYNNVFINCNERLPRVRYGNVHVFNNYYYAETFNEAYTSLTVDNYYHDDNVFPHYFIGLGIESNVLSEYNSFNYAGNQEIPASEDIIVYSYGGYIFHDNGSEFNGKKIDIDAIAEKSFHTKVQTKMAQNATKNATNPDWTSATFTTDAFHPSSYYEYEVKTNLDEVNDLINKVPSWMFGLDEPNDVKPSATAIATKTTIAVPLTNAAPISMTTINIPTQVLPPKTILPTKSVLATSVLPPIPELPSTPVLPTQVLPTKVLPTQVLPPTPVLPTPVLPTQVLPPTPVLSTTTVISAPTSTPQTTHTPENSPKKNNGGFKDLINDLFGNFHFW